MQGQRHSSSCQESGTCGIPGFARIFTDLRYAGTPSVLFIVPLRWVFVFPVLRVDVRHVHANAESHQERDCIALFCEIDMAPIQFADAAGVPPHCVCLCLFCPCLSLSLSLGVSAFRRFLGELGLWASIVALFARSVTLRLGLQSFALFLQGFHTKKKYVSLRVGVIVGVGAGIGVCVGVGVGVSVGVRGGVIVGVGVGRRQQCQCQCQGRCQGRTLNFQALGSNYQVLRFTFSGQFCCFPSLFFFCRYFSKA